MAGNRKAAEQYIVKYIGELENTLEGKPNQKFYIEYFATLNDKQFDQFMKDLESGVTFLVMQYPNFSKGKITVDNNLRVAELLGHNFFERLWIEGDKDRPTYLTPVEYLVIDIPQRRASQTLTKKISVPDHTRVTNALTGQPTGESKGAKISYPELQVCAAMDLDNSMIELVKFRGGDNRGLAAFNALLSRQGQVSLNTLNNYASGVESTKTLQTYLTAAHLKSTLLDRKRA